MGLLKITEDTGVRILPHEHTHDAAKTDRFTLWSALKSDLSPIFVGYADKAGKIDRIFLKELANPKALSGSGGPRQGQTYDLAA